MIPGWKDWGVGMGYGKHDILRNKGGIETSNALLEDGVDPLYIYIIIKILTSNNYIFYIYLKFACLWKNFNRQNL